MEYFNPNGAADPYSDIFGLPFKDAKIIIIPVPWDATSSYGAGTSKAPSAIFNASKYVELFDVNLGDFYKKGITMASIPTQLNKKNQLAKRLASPIIEQGGTQGILRLQQNVIKIDECCKTMNEYSLNKTTEVLNESKVVGMIGGDHSISLGCIKAHLAKYPEMGVLQIDAHCDLRECFEDFTYSHASVMFNVLKETNLSTLVQVGVRGLCAEEYQRINNSNGRIHTFFNASLQEKKHRGTTWQQICDEIILELPQEIYISFDIDGLDPSLCPSTGTPIPGGLSYGEAITLMKKIAESGKTIIGFDLVEVAPGKNGDWDANVGAHLLYQLCGWCLRSSEPNN